VLCVLTYSPHHLLCRNCKGSAWTAFQCNLNVVHLVCMPALSCPDNRDGSLFDHSTSNAWCPNALFAGGGVCQHHRDSQQQSSLPTVFMHALFSQQPKRVLSTFRQQVTLHGACHLCVLLLQVVVCANTPEEQQELLESGCDAIYCNQNAWLDYHNLFTLQSSTLPSCIGRRSLCRGNTAKRESRLSSRCCHNCLPRRFNGMFNWGCACKQHHCS
jgi:hypothetical protein